ncbi:MAG: amidohydrolase family protein, partial [Chloroflexota bacterium]|nr:amidohydrolase family protein [Chloroflexota bacterium]
MDYRVISADDHIDVRFLPADLWTSRAPARLRERVPHLEPVDGLAFWVCDGQRWGRWGQYAADGPAKWALEAGGVMTEGELRPTTPELRLADMDRDGVDATVMYGPTDPFSVPDPELRYELHRAYNDWLIDFCSNAPERLIGAAQLPRDDPARARTEMERCAGLGFRHVNLMAARAVPPVWHEDWEPFWAMAEESGIPVGFHLAVLTFNRPTEGVAYSHPVVDRAAGSLRVSMQLIEPICGVIFGGVLDRHPELK